MAGNLTQDGDQGSARRGDKLKSQDNSSAATQESSVYYVYYHLDF